MSVLLTCSSLLRSSASHSHTQHGQALGARERPGPEACTVWWRLPGSAAPAKDPLTMVKLCLNGLLAFSTNLSHNFIPSGMWTPLSAVTGRMTNLKILPVTVDFTPCEAPAPGSGHFHKALFPSLCLNSTIPVCLWSRKWEQKQAGSLASWDLIPYCSHRAVQDFGENRFQIVIITLQMKVTSLNHTVDVLY